jgi:hypothetical protein
MGKAELLSRLRADGISLNRAAELLFQDERFRPTQQRRAIEVACCAVAELGFERGASYAEVVRIARERRLSECPLELAACLRLEFRDQVEAAPSQAPSAHRAPPGALTVASPPLDDTDETPKGFYLQRRDGALWLRGYWAPLNHVWQPEDLFVFRREPGSRP